MMVKMERMRGRMRGEVEEWRKGGAEEQGGRVGMGRQKTRQGEAAREREVVGRRKGLRHGAGTVEELRRSGAVVELIGEADGQWGARRPVGNPQGIRITRPLHNSNILFANKNKK